MWTWCFRAPLFTLFKIDPSRGSDVLLNVLGTEFRGVLGCDYFSAYRKYLRLNENVLVQFCLAHLIRDVRFLVEHPNSKNRAYGQRVLAALRDLFGLIHCRGRASEAKFRGRWKIRATKSGRRRPIACRRRRKPRISPSGSISMAGSICGSSPRPVLNPPTIWRNKPFGSSSSTAV